MKFRKHPLRLLSFAFVLLCLLTGLTGLSVAPRQVDAAPQMQIPADSLIISEFRLQGSNGSNDEFIEIFNPTGSAVDLQGWAIGGANAQGNSMVRYTFPAGVSLQPGQHYLIAHTNFDDTDADVIYLQAIADNGGVAIIDNLGNVIDSAGLSSGTVYHEGNPLTPLTGNLDQSYDRQANCGDSDDNVADFYLRNPSDPQDSFSTLSICTNPTATATSTSTVTATATATSTSTTTATATSVPSIPAVIINEVAWSGTGSSANDEWIELYNTSSNTVNLDGWILKSTDNTPNIPLVGSSIGPKEYLVITRTAGTFSSGVDPTIVLVSDTLNLSDSGERISLLSGTVTIDTVTLTTTGWPAGDGSTRSSMERVGVSDLSRWVTYGGTTPIALDRGGGAIKGTPGKSNWISTASVTIITSDSPDPSLVNQNVTVNVTVVGGTTRPTGTVLVSGGNTPCTITLTSGSGSCVMTFTSAGSKTLTALYSGDSTHPVSSDTESHQVSTTTTIRTPTRAATLAPPPPLVAINEFVPRPGHDWNLDGEVNVQDEYIEIINHGTINVNLSGYTVDDEANIGSSPYSLPSVIIKPGERIVFYGSETGLLLSDGGDGVRLLKPNGQLMDAYNYTVARYSDQSYCRLPDDGGLDDWNQNCYPTPGLQNSLSGSFLSPVNGVRDVPYCPIADTLPDGFVLAECAPFGNNIWRWAFWDATGWYGEKRIPGMERRWDVFVD